MVKPRPARVLMDEEHLRVAKGVASFKGMTLKEYLGSMVEQDARRFKQNMEDEIFNLDPPIKSRYRRGQLAVDILLMCVVMFCIAVVFVWVSKLNTDITAPLIAQNATGTVGTQMLVSQNVNYAPLWDNLGIFIFGLVWLFLIVSSYYIRSNPVFFIIMLILMISSLIVIMIVGNTFDDMTHDTEFAQNAAHFPKLTWLMYHYLSVSVVVFLTCGIALYAKPGGGAF